MGLFIVLTVLLALTTVTRASPIQANSDVIIFRTNGNFRTCSQEDALSWSYEFHNCFIDRKYADGGKDLDNIVDRILEHASQCIGNGTKPCRPDFNGFMEIVNKVISQMQDYTGLYLEDIYKGKENIKDLDCVERSLSNETYAKCFKSVFDEPSVRDEKIFEEDVEKAISCTNKSNKLCSKAAKTSLNRIVRTVLKVKQPEKEDIEEDKPPKPPKRWYEYITEPFVYAWNAIKNFFSNLFG